MDNRPIALIIVLLLLLPGALAMPRVPSEFRGWVIIEGRYARDGTVITVLDDSGTVCGASIVTDGHYGPLSCSGDDPTTPNDEGADMNEPLTFLVNGQDINTKDAVRWRPGQSKEVNLLQGDLEEAAIFLISRSSTLDSFSVLILSFVVICSLCIVTMCGILLARFISSRKKRMRWLQIE
jgi:hypothetical protein